MAAGDGSSTRDIGDTAGYATLGHSGVVGIRVTDPARDKERGEPVVLCPDCITWKVIAMMIAWVGSRVGRMWAVEIS